MKVFILCLFITIYSCSKSESKPSEVNSEINFSQAESKQLILPKENHFKNLKQLTFDGQNAEAYFDFTFNKVIFQRLANDDEGYDIIHEMDLNGQHMKQLSSGNGTTTCSYFMPDGKSYIYASTHGGDRELFKPDYSLGYVWPLYPDFDIYQAEYPSNKIIKKLTVTDRYDAEATISPIGDKIVFTSLRDDDLEIYVMNIDGSNQKRLTNLPGFDGGPFFSWDGKQIVWRGSHPDDQAELDRQKQLLDKDLMSPGALDIYVMDADGSNQRKVTDNQAANFGPFFHPDNNRIIFASNMDDPQKRNFDLYLINKDGSNQERITYFESFDGFPMFDKSGKHLVFASNRHNKPGTRDTNVFIAEWVD